MERTPIEPVVCDVNPEQEHSRVHKVASKIGEYVVGLYHQLGVIGSIIGDRVEDQLQSTLDLFDGKDPADESKNQTNNIGTLDE